MDSEFVKLNNGKYMEISEAISKCKNRKWVERQATFVIDGVIVFAIQPDSNIMYILCLNENAINNRAIIKLNDLSVVEYSSSKYSLKLMTDVVKKYKDIFIMHFEEEWKNAKF